MKTILFIVLLTTVSCLGLSAAFAAEAAPPAKAERVGIYDSRVLAYAYFWSPSGQAIQQEAFAAAKEAKAKGDTNRLAESKAEMKKRQEKNHLQVFSTAPVDDVLAAIQERVDLVQQQAGVSHLVSKWDEAGLKAYQSAEQVDVTDQLLGAFKLDEKQKKVAADIRKHDPLPLAKARELLRQGKL